MLLRFRDWGFRELGLCCKIIWIVFRINWNFLLLKKLLLAVVNLVYDCFLLVGNCLMPRNQLKKHSTFIVFKHYESIVSLVNWLSWNPTFIVVFLYVILGSYFQVPNHLIFRVALSSPLNYTILNYWVHLIRVVIYLLISLFNFMNFMMEIGMCHC